MRLFKKKLKVLFVYHKGGCNEPYLLECFSHLSWLSPFYVKTVSLQKYVNYNQNASDIIIYNTFAGEFHKKLYIPFKPLMGLTDRKFLSFGGPKILFDAHDSGSDDGFKRFRDPNIARIKNAPHVDFLKKFNVICSTTYPIKILPIEDQVKDITLSYCVSLETNPIRKKILIVLEKYAKENNIYLDIKRDKSPIEYRHHLNRVLISVVPPGWGEGTFRHLETMNAGSLLLAHSSINKIKLLPNADLKDGRDYVTFDLGNLENKLSHLLSHPKLIDQISKNGYEKLIEGYSPKKTRDKLAEKLGQIYTDSSKII
jgi:hypothetical protein